ncbi:hypothetical protein [Leptothoe sp. PORK10 BA2]|uniref:hypothetical protein n=1 Tax=Leptothoe sp. PORK10 BA2 TaxID=3110254 RepID=UPI002B1F8F0F|nr:hypothetical protein [Leptothoe sp. PORK10 BA2]MEA5466227.1 hypothetical protein [Leptothoe sp. PORK10 BA2]
MTNNPQQDELTQIIRGFTLLMGLHCIAIMLIFIVGFGIGMIAGGYTFLGIWIVGAMGFLFWQLLYVIPLILRFRHRRQFAMMKGIIIGATITALVNGACFLATI